MEPLQPEQATFLLQLYRVMLKNEYHLTKKVIEVFEGQRRRGSARSSPPDMEVDLLRILISAILAIGVLYATIWPHELGHSVAAYLYGCKSNWWRTYMSWYLWSSWAGPVDYDCLQAAGRGAMGVTDFAGVGVNLLLLCLAPVVGQWWHSPASKGSIKAWVFVGTVFWALANYAEAFSYLVLNTLWLSSDMKTVVLLSAVSRWVWCGLGLAVAVCLWRLLLGPLRSAANFLKTPGVSERNWLVIFAVYVCVVSLTMGAARIVLAPPSP